MTSVTPLLWGEEMPLGEETIRNLFRFTWGTVRQFGHFTLWGSLTIMGITDSQQEKLNNLNLTLKRIRHSWVRCGDAKGEDLSFPKLKYPVI